MLISPLLSGVPHKCLPPYLLSAPSHAHLTWHPVIIPHSPTWVLLGHLAVHGYILSLFVCFIFPLLSLTHLFLLLASLSFPLPISLQLPLLLLTLCLLLHLDMQYIHQFLSGYQTSLSYNATCSVANGTLSLWTLLFLPHLSLCVDTLYHYGLNINTQALLCWKAGKSAQFFPIFLCVGFWGNLGPFLILSLPLLAFPYPFYHLIQFQLWTLDITVYEPVHSTSPFPAYILFGVSCLLPSKTHSSADNNPHIPLSSHSCMHSSCGRWTIAHLAQVVPRSDYFSSLLLWHTLNLTFLFVTHVLCPMWQN